MDTAVLVMYFVSLLILFSFGSQGFFMIYYHLKFRHKHHVTPIVGGELPVVTIQLPVYNELHVVERLIRSSAQIEYPKEKLEIQVLDDSTDETTELIAGVLRELKSEGYDISHIRRGTREGFKAGALKYGLTIARGEFIAIFDADFIPRKEFLSRTIPFFQNPKIGMVQTRWEHLNGNYSFLTRTQAMALDGHFVIEQSVRNKAGFFINFNGTGGVWRKSTIEDAGNWQADTLTEDLDLSYRAQLRGWEFIFLPEVTSPAELPSEINALKSQQFRWTKGAIETARKILPKLWSAPDVPLRNKIQGTIHLTNNIVFPFILLAGILNVPLVFLKASHHYEWYFSVMSIFVFAFIGSFMFYLYSQKDVYADWKRRLLLFPVFMAGSMGFAVNNSKAVIEGLIRHKTEFVRTPKYGISTKKDRWDKSSYVPVKLNITVVIEVILAMYCFVGVVASFYYLELAAVPFQLMYFLGYAFVAALSIKHAFSARRPRAAVREA